MALWIAAGVLVPIIGSELALGGRRLQTALARALAVWGASLAAAIGAADYAGISLVAIAVFWSGAFLAWFGVRSHVESSMLLRLVVLLHRKPMPDNLWLDEYASFYGESQRMEELRRGGFIAGPDESASLTPKGKAILRRVDNLQRPSVPYPLIWLLIAASCVVCGLHRALDVPRGVNAVYSTTPNQHGDRGPGREVDMAPSGDLLRTRQPDFALHPFSVTWRGFIVVPQGGSYTFKLVSDGAAAISIEGAEVVTHTAGPGATGANGTKSLDAGVHRIVIRYDHDPGECVFEVWWSRAGTPIERLPVWALVPERVSSTRLFLYRVTGFLARVLIVVWYVLGAGLLITWLFSATRRLVAVPGERVDPMLVGLLILSLLLNVWGIWWGMPNTRGWGPDEVVPADVLRAFQLAFSHGWYQKYPPFHYLVLAAADSPILVLSWLGLFDVAAPAPYLTLAIIGRLVSLIFGVAAIAVVYRCGRQLYGVRGAASAALIVALTIPFPYYGKLANLDVPYLFWFAVSLLAYIRILQRHATRDYVLFAVSAALAGCTKDQVWGAYVFTPLAILAARWQASRQSGRSVVGVLFDRTTLSALAVGTGVFLVADNVVLNAGGFAAHVRLLLGTPAEFQAFPRTPAGELQLAWRSVLEMRYMFGWPLAAIVAIAFVRGVSGATTTPSLRWLLVPALSYYVAFVAVILFYFDRYLFPITVVLALFAGYWLERFVAPGVRARRMRVALVAAAFAYSVVYVAAIDYAMTRDSRYAVTRWLRDRARPDDTVGSFGPLEYFAIAGGFHSVSVESIDHVVAVHPAFIVLSPDQLPSWPERARAMREWLIAGGAGYRLALRARSSALPIPGGHPDLGPQPRHGPEITDLSLINPTMEIYERIEPKQ